MSEGAYLLKNTTQKTGSPALRSTDSLHIRLNVDEIVWKFNDFLGLVLEKHFLKYILTYILETECGSLSVQLLRPMEPQQTTYSNVLRELWEQLEASEVESE